MNIQANPNLIKCIESVPDRLPVLGRLDIKKSHVILFHRQGDLFYYTPPVTPYNYVAAFDIDWTLTYSEQKLFPKDHTDIQLLPNRQEKLTRLFKMGYTIALFTNQKVKGQKQKLERVERIATLVKKLDVPCYAFIATGDDDYRKPATGMWEKMKECVPNIKHAFFVGDALGRPQDFSDSDKMFAGNAGLPYYTPEEFFDHDIIIFNSNKNMVILVGMPGSGKSSYAKKELVPLGFEHISRDILGGNKTKVFKAVKQAVNDENSLVIDATNPKQEDREIYYDIAEKAGYSVTVLYFVRDGRGFNNLRIKNKVPTISYHIYFKNLDPPNEENTPGDVFLID